MTMTTTPSGESDVPDREVSIRRQAQGDDPEAWIELGGWLLLNGRPAHEYRPWLQKVRGSRLNGHHVLIEFLLDDLVAAGRPDDAFEALVLAGAASEGEAALRVALRWDRHRPQEAEAWYRRAARAKEPAGLVAYGQWLEKAGRGEEAGPLYKEADVLGDRSGALFVGRWYAARGRQEQALDAAGRAVRRAGAEAELYGRNRLRDTLFEAGDVAFLCGDVHGMADLYAQAEAVVYVRSPESADWTTAVTTITVSVALVPFVQALVGQAAQDAHEAARNALRRMFQHRKHPDAVLAEPRQRILVARDFSRELTLRIPTEATDDALDALARLDFPSPPSAPTEEHQGTLHWNTSLQRWEFRQ
jgi:tetratricopeptide (TPR) repeat protein